MLTRSSAASNTNIDRHTGVHVYTCIHMYRHIYIYIYIYIHTVLSIYLSIYRSISLHIYIYMYICICIRTYVLLHSYAHTGRASTSRAQSCRRSRSMCSMLYDNNTNHNTTTNTNNGPKLLYPCIVHKTYMYSA